MLHRCFIGASYFLRCFIGSSYWREGETIVAPSDLPPEAGFCLLMGNAVGGVCCGWRGSMHRSGVGCPHPKRHNKYSTHLKYHYFCSKTRQGLEFFWCKKSMVNRKSVKVLVLAMVRKIFSRFPESANIIFHRSRLRFSEHFRGSTPENASGAMFSALNC